MAIEIPNQLVAQVTITGTFGGKSAPVNQRTIVRGGAKVLTNANAGDAPASNFLIWTPGLTFWASAHTFTGNATVTTCACSTDEVGVIDCGPSDLVQKEVAEYNLANGTSVPWQECNVIRTGLTGFSGRNPCDGWIHFHATPQTT